MNGREYRGREFEKPVTPTPDYDSVIYNSNNNNNRSEDRPKSTSSIPPHPPPMQKLTKQATVKAPAPPKPNRSISVTIGEYDSRKEPSKLGFLNKTNNSNNINGASTSQMLQNELQMTLSRSNLKKTAEVAKQGQMPNGNGPEKVTKSVLEKTGSANIERLTAMLNSRGQSNGTVNGAGVGAVNGINSNGTNKVTISIAKSKAPFSNDSSDVKVSPNGILKTTNGGTPTTTVYNSATSSGMANGNGGSTANGEVKNIKFDNM